MLVRVIEYRLEGLDGAESLYRLVTSILDPVEAPAVELAALYHERWEIETAFAELKTHLRGAKIVLRSKTPELVRQEFYGLLMTHFAVRGLMHEAALDADLDPDRLSFLQAVRVVRRKLTAWNHSRTPQEDLIGMGNMALLKAARQWKPTQGAKFATYAKGFILRGIERGQDDTENLIRIPIKVREEMRKLMYTERALTQTLGRQPTANEIATILNKTTKRINQLKFYMQQEPASLDALQLDKLEDNEDE